MIIWKIWLGSDEVPERFNQYTETWTKISGGEIITVTDKNVHEWTGKTAKELKDHFKNNIQVANHWLRYYLMYKYGGIYLDLDVEVLKDSEIWYIKTPVFFAETIIPLWINNHVMVCNTPKQDVYYNLANMTWFTELNDQKIEINTGPGLVTKFLKQGCNNVSLYDPEYTTPWNWNEKPDRTRITENTLAVHHFTHSWKK